MISRSFISAKRGLVWVLGGLLLISLMIFLHSNKWLVVSFFLVVCAPDGDGSDEVGVSVGVVEI